MTRYRINAELEINVGQSGKSVADARAAERQIAATLQAGFNELLFTSPTFQDALWTAAGAAENREENAVLAVKNVSEI